MAEQQEFQRKYGPWALVVGGSKGIGEAYSRQLAAKGMNLVITARGEQELNTLAEDLQARHAIEVRTVTIDLDSERVLDLVLPAVEGLEIGLLVYNTAYYDIKEFFDSDIDTHLRTLNVNCRGLLLFVHHFGQLMKDRRKGGIIVMSSMSGWQGAALLTSYAATKAFDTVLGEGLWEELRAYGVDVLSFVAGATRTPNFQSMTPLEKQKDAFPMMPEQVAKEALSALGHTSLRIAGPINKMASFVLNRLLPRKLAVRFMSSTNRKLYGP
jgi:hypothetical protein